MIALRNVSKHFGKTPALVNVNLEIPVGKRVVIVGGSGAGKTTLLRVLGGLETPDAGAVFRGEVDITKVEAHKRGIAILSQDYAIYPHLTIEKNLLAALEPLKLANADREERITSALRWFELTELRARRPAQLSGGQLQRAALAKALVRRPQSLLLDEPLSQLDVALREQGRALLESLSDEFGTTLVMVTHDSFDALRMADVLVVLERGSLVQVDAPDVVYRSPKTRSVADLLSPFGLNEVELASDRASSHADVSSAKSKLFFRPEAATIAGVGSVSEESTSLNFGGTVTRIQGLGFATLVTVLLAGSTRTQAVKVLDQSGQFAIGQSVKVRVASRDLLRF